jgi:hypothetical protein
MSLHQWGYTRPIFSFRGFCAYSQKSGGVILVTVPHLFCTVATRFPSQPLSTRCIPYSNHIPILDPRYFKKYEALSRHRSHDLPERLGRRGVERRRC